MSNAIIPIVELRVSKYDSVALKELHTGESSTLYISVENSGQSSAFHFETPEQAKQFILSILSTLDAYV